MTARIKTGLDLLGTAALGFICGACGVGTVFFIGYIGYQLCRLTCG